MNLRSTWENPDFRTTSARQGRRPLSLPAAVRALGMYGRGVLALLPLLLAACSGGPDGEVGQLSLQPADEPPLAAAVANPSPAQPLFDANPAAILPGIVATEMLSGSALTIAYTDEAQRQGDTATFVTESWNAMLECLEATAEPPVVVLQTDEVQPLSSRDDVIFSFEGRIVASAHEQSDAPLIQVLYTDVAAQAANRGDYLRSILGRYIWRSNGLAERDYDYSCARNQVPAQ